MNNLVITGTIGLDDIKTPFGKARAVLGGSGTYASFAAAFFLRPALLAVVGQDFPAKYLQILEEKADSQGLVQKGKNFRWSGEYLYDMNEAKTLKTSLNALKNYRPILPPKYRQARYLFLAATDPLHQLSIHRQAKSRPFTVLDTRAIWIEDARKNLLKIIKQVNLFVLNDAEARLLCQTPNLIKAGRSLLDLGPEYVVIKKGEHGALLFSYHGIFSAPAYPLEEVKDPTGAGDSFAGGLIGYLAKKGKTDEKTVRQGIIFGSAIASFCAEDFGTEKLKKINLKDIKERYEVFRQIRKF